MAKTLKKKKAADEPRVYKCGSADLDKLMVLLGEIKLDPENSRLHPERSLAAIGESLERFGYQKPVVVDPSGVVVAGNGTVEAARKLGWTHAPVVRTNLEGRARVAFAIADNRLGELSEWDESRLVSQLGPGGGVDPAVVGFSQAEIQRLTVALNPSAPESFPVVDEAVETQHECPGCGYQWSGKTK